MKKIYILAIVLILLSLIVFILPKNDSNSDKYDKNISIGLGKVNDTYIGIGPAQGKGQTAQSFIPKENLTCYSFSAFIKRNGEKTDLIMEIQTDHNNTPSQIAVASEKANQEIISNEKFEWIEVYPIYPFELKAGTRYWFYLKAPNGDFGRGYLWGSATGTNADYTEGNAIDTWDFEKEWKHYLDYDMFIKVRCE